MREAGRTAPDASPSDGTAELEPLGGEFRSKALEAEYDATRADETFRHGRLLLTMAALLNSLFFISDWRFAGTSHFWVAIAARAATVVIALACLWAARRCTTSDALRRVMFVWMIATSVAVGVLVTSRSDLALFVVLLLPAIFYLLVPATFRGALVGGTWCSLLLLIGYGEHAESIHTAVGIALGVVMLNVTLAMFVTRQNRQARLTWLAARDERRTRLALAASQDTLTRIIDASPAPLVVWDRATGAIVIANTSWRELMRGTADKLDLAEVRRHYVDPDAPNRMIEILDRDGRVDDFETQVRLADGEIRTVVMRWSLIDVPSGPMVASGMFDVTERKRAEQLLAEMASTDALTGLINRKAFFSLAEIEAAKLAASGRAGTLLMIDLDHFKSINDRFGHSAGDAALAAFATAATRALGADRILARIGGEEFAAMIVDADEGQALRLAERLRVAVSQLRLHVDGEPVCLTASIGVATLGGPDWDLRSALARADRALYQAKRGGRNRISHGTPREQRLAS